MRSSAPAARPSARRFILDLLLLPPLAVAGLLCVATITIMVIGFPEESRRAGQVTLAPGANELRVVYGAWGLPDEVELRLRGASPAEGERRFEVGPDNQPSDVIRLVGVTCVEGDEACRASLASQTFEITVVNTMEVEAAVVFEAVARDDQGIESTSLIRLDVVERIVP